MTACRHDLRAYLVGASSWAELPVALHYREIEPYAVTLSIGADGIDWQVSRELLRTGTKRPAGEGDVRFWPGRLSPNDELFVLLRSPSGQALLELSRAAVLDFLWDTETLVPAGTESCTLTVDAELQTLTDGETD
jgi:Streptomyces sporulation and cell division protein, SsgA